MAIHPDFPTSPHQILHPEHRWFPADEILRESSYEKLLPPLRPHQIAVPYDNHAMRLNEKFRNAEMKDFKRIAEDFDIADWSGIVEKIRATFEKWPAVAKECAVAEKCTTGIGGKIRENIKAHLLL